MKRKLCSYLVAAVLIFSNVSHVYAADYKKDFYDSVELTKDILDKEIKNLESADLGSKILENLLKDAYQTKFSLGFNKIPENSEIDLSKLTFDAESKHKENGEDFTAGFSFNVPKEIFSITKDFKLDLNLYFLDKKLGVNIPQLFDGYYYIDTNTFVEDYINSDFNEIQPMDPVYLAALQQSFKPLDELENLQPVLDKYNAMADGALKIFQKYKDAAVYTYDGKSLIDAKRGPISANKYSLRLNKDNANKLIDDFADFIEKDKSVYEYYKSVYSFSTEEEEEMIKYLQSNYAETLRGIEAWGDFRFSIYTNEQKQIYRYELDAALNVKDYDYDMPFNLVVFLDTKGENNLLDEIYLNASLVEGGDTIGFVFDMYGNILPNNGVEKSKFNLSMVSGGKTSDYTIEKLLTGDYKFDSGKKTDNLKFELQIMPDYVDDTQSVTISMLGDVDNDVENNKISTNLKSIKLLSGKTLLLDMFLKYSANPYNSKDIVFPENPINLFSLRKAQIEEMVEKINTNLQKMYQ